MSIDVPLFYVDVITYQYPNRRSDLDDNRRQGIIWTNDLLNKTMHHKRKWQFTFKFM